MDDYLTSFQNVLDGFSNLNQFVFDMFNDKRIPDEVKEEYAERYSSLKIHKINE